MATNKRASMREGPLADLFRKTAAETSGKPETEQSAQEKPPDAPQPAASEHPPAAHELRHEPPAPPAATPPTQAATPPPRAATAPPAEQRRRFRHPSFDSKAAPEEPEERHIPSPQERLRQAFSADIPENVLDAPPARTRTRTHAAEPTRDVYARSQAAPEVPAGMPALGPVLRVVGVGGGGVNAVNRMVE